MIHIKLWGKMNMMSHIFKKTIIIGIIITLVTTNIVPLITAEKEDISLNANTNINLEKNTDGTGSFSFTSDFT